MEAAWFGGRLRELRGEAGLTRKQLAEACGFRSEGGIRDLELNVTLPGWAVVIALCKALGVTPEAFAVEPNPLYQLRPRRGRPRKPKPPAPEAPKRPRGRPRKEK